MSTNEPDLGSDTMSAIRAAMRAEYQRGLAARPVLDLPAALQDEANRANAATESKLAAAERTLQMTDAAIADAGKERDEALAKAAEHLKAYGLEFKEHKACREQLAAAERERDEARQYFAGMEKLLLERQRKADDFDRVSKRLNDVGAERDAARRRIDELCTKHNDLLRDVSAAKTPAPLTPAPLSASEVGALWNGCAATPGYVSSWEAMLGMDKTRIINFANACRTWEVAASACRSDAPTRHLTREQLGRIVRETWVDFARTQSNPKPHHLLPWEELDEPNREVDRLIGEAIARAVTGGAAAPPPPLPACPHPDAIAAHLEGNALRADTVASVLTWCVRAIERREREGAGE